MVGVLLRSRTRPARASTAADPRPPTTEPPPPRGARAQAILGVADQVIDAVKTGKLEHIFLIVRPRGGEECLPPAPLGHCRPPCPALPLRRSPSQPVGAPANHSPPWNQPRPPAPANPAPPKTAKGGCDGAEKSRKYYSQLGESLPASTMILTLGCAKYRINHLDFGNLPGTGLPRLLDMGQVGRGSRARRGARAGGGLGARGRGYCPPLSQASLSPPPPHPIAALPPKSACPTSSTPPSP
jgi:hypothetical protein